MKILILLPFLICVLVSCNNSGDLKTKLIGKWTTNKKPVQGHIIEIKSDSIYYPFYEKSFKYELTKDSFKLYFTDMTFEAKYSLKDDSLFFFTENGVDTNFRVR